MVCAWRPAIASLPSFLRLVDTSGPIQLHFCSPHPPSPRYPSPRTHPDRPLLSPSQHHVCFWLVLVLDLTLPLLRQHPTTVSDIFFTMQRTPSPPRRLHTPPAPMHGDAYEPFSPRRSSRVAAQRDTHIHLHPQAASPRARRDVTPTAASQRKSTARIGHFTLSPPPSPVPSPQHRSPRSTRSARALDSDPDHAASTSAVRFLSTLAPVSQPRVCIGFVRAIAGQQTLRYSTRPPIPPC
jgi:hypothetical protein